MMSDIKETFIFRDDLHIESSFDKEDEASLSALLDDTEKEILSIKEEILTLSKHLEEKQKKEISIKERLEKFTSPKLEIKLNTPTISEANTSREQIEFMFNLFHGRRDTFATRGLNKTKDGIAYYTACNNNFSPGCLHTLPDEEKKGKSCKDCEIRDLTELTVDIYKKNNIHNSSKIGKGAVGIYAILPGNMCRFLAIDLDEKSWKHDALEIADAARRDGFQIAIERSFSGNGAHLWLFFSEEVPALKARQLAFSFIDKACEKSKAVSLKSYDRIFPTQDTVSNNGFGNLILMPIVCSAAMRTENPGTVFVDNDFVKYPKQIPFLSSVPRYTRKDVELYLTSPKSSFASSIEFSPFSDNEGDVLWRNRLPQISQKDSLVDTLPVFLSAGLSIPKDALSPKLENALKRLACFSNPEYFIAKNRNNGYIPEGVSLFIETYIESNEVLQLPRGLKNGLEKYLSESGISYKIQDKRSAGTKLDAVFKGTLREEQIEAFDALMKNEIGILQAATSFGKTVIAAKIIAERKEKTLILVQSKPLLDQWKEGLESFLTIHNTPLKREGKRINKNGIGIYSSSSDSLSSYVDIAMLQTLSKRMPEFIRSYGLVIVDECHHLAADTFIKVMHAVRPRYLYGLSATVTRKDRMEKLVYAQCGPVIYKYGADKLQYKRGIAQYLVPRFTKSISSRSYSSKFNNTLSQKDIASDTERNKLITDDIVKLYSKERRILVLTRLVDHIEEIKKELGAKDIPSISVHGSMSTIEKKETLGRIKDDNNKAVIISTGSFLGEGMDIPYLDTLIVAAPISWKGIVSQYVGRISREYEGKKNVLIYDYVDVFIPAFVAMYNKRLKTYKELGYIIKEDGENAPLEHPIQSLYSQDDIIPILLVLIRESKEEIVISSPYLSKGGGTMTIIKELGEVAKHNIAVEIRTNSSKEKNAFDVLNGTGIKVTSSPSCYLKFASFDRKKLLFGDLDILGSAINIKKDTEGENSKSEDPYVMLFITNQEVASSLVEPTLFS